MATPKKRMNNEQFFTALVKGKLTPNVNPLFVHMFLMDALIKLSDKVAVAKPEDIGENAVVHPQSWINTAKEIKKVMDERLKG